jgi:hypothetical protein
MMGRERLLQILYQAFPPPYLPSRDGISRAPFDMQKLDTSEGNKCAVIKGTLA